MDIHIWYTVLSAIVGGVMGARARLGEVFYAFIQHFMELILGFGRVRHLLTVPIH